MELILKLLEIAAILFPIGFLYLYGEVHWKKVREKSFSQYLIEAIPISLLAVLLDGLVYFAILSLIYLNYRP